jgi:hypothetical protein
LEEWRHVADWALPFDGRAEYVPEFNTWLGFEAHRGPHHLCAVDLAAMEYGQPPTTQYRWEDLSLPQDVDCCPVRLSLVNLGARARRFCISKVYNDYENQLQYAVLTGVEMLAAKKTRISGLSSTGVYVTSPELTWSGGFVCNIVHA